jgi:hypothetical protein
MVGRAKRRARKTLEDIIVQGTICVGTGVNDMGIECSSKDGRKN